MYINGKSILSRIESVLLGEVRVFLVKVSEYKYLV